jgi:hypothetical protein
MLLVRETRPSIDLNLLPKALPIRLVRPTIEHPRATDGRTMSLRSTDSASSRLSNVGENPAEHQPIFIVVRECSSSIRIREGSLTIGHRRAVTAFG